MKKLIHLFLVAFASYNLVFGVVFASIHNEFALLLVITGCLNATLITILNVYIKNIMFQNRCEKKQIEIISDIKNMRDFAVIYNSKHLNLTTNEFLRLYDESKN